MKDRPVSSTNDVMMTTAMEICGILRNNGKECYMVGGSVRDMIMGNSIHDIDIATNALPEDIINIFSMADIKTISTGIKFGTITVLMKHNPVEITTYRKDEKYSDFRHPDSVLYASTIENDLSRRDFTINAMAYDPVDKILKDPNDGQKDINRKIIRAVGNPAEKLNEDILRAYRACRFSSKLGFSIDPATERAIKEKSGLAKRLSNERIRDEILKTMESTKPSIGIKCMADGGLFDHVLPEIVALKGIKQPIEFHSKDVFGHTLDVVDAIPAGKTTLRIAGLFHDIGKPSTFKKIGEKITFRGHDDAGAAMFPAIGERLKLTGADIDFVKGMIANHLIEYDDTWNDAAIRRLVNRVGKDRIDDLLTLNEADYEKKAPGNVSMASKVRDRIAEMDSSNTPTSIGIKDLKVAGKDVMAVLGIKPGPEVGRVLNRLLEAVIADPSLNEKEKLVGMMGANRP
jgi:poly(A) polymerase/tRNA nucleotidyltransferase (CCA-adding enzyme)